jgi:hypothetical protein
MPTRAIAAIVGVSHVTVARDLHAVTDVTPGRKVTGMDGKTYEVPYTVALRLVRAKPKPEPDEGDDNDNTPALSADTPVMVADRDAAERRKQRRLDAFWDPESWGDMQMWWQRKFDEAVREGRWDGLAAANAAFQAIAEYAQGLLDSRSADEEPQ